MKKAHEEDLSRFAPVGEGKVAGLGRMRCYDAVTTKGFPPESFCAGMALRSCRYEAIGPDLSIFNLSSLCI